MIDLATLDRPPAGFAACVRCAYRDTGSAPICFACASENTEPIPERSCEVCSRPLDPGESCPNPICSWADREFNRVWAISMRAGEMERAISRYKYQGRWGWAAIFGRILVGFLDERSEVFSRFDLIIPSPTYMGEGVERGFDHIERIIRAAEVEEPIRWPFAYGVIVKDARTEPLMPHTWPERRLIAEGELRSSLRVPDPSLVQGRRILVFDDVFTEGFTIREVAGALNRAGAAEVSEVVLARQPWHGG